MEEEKAGVIPRNVKKPWISLFFQWSICILELGKKRTKEGMPWKRSNFYVFL